MAAQSRLEVEDKSVDHLEQRWIRKRDGVSSGILNFKLGEE